MRKNRRSVPYQYEPLITPSSWMDDEQRFSIRLTQIIDDLYQKYSALRQKTKNVEPSTPTDEPVDADTLNGKTAYDFLAVDGTAVNAEKLGGKAPEYYLQPRNLLDNSDFTNLIAQAGIGGYHGTVAYAADRWILDSGTVSYDAGVGLTLDGTIRQKLAFQPTGQTSPFVGMTSGEASISYADGAVTITSGGGVIKWAALYEGSYTSENVPPFVSPDPLLELLKCQKYCFVVNPDWASVHIGKIFSNGSGMLITFRTPVAMYGAPNSVPSVVIDNLGLVDFYTVSGCIAGATNVAVQTSTQNGVSLLFSTNGNTTPNTPCATRLNTKILLSHDL